ncbi:MAG: hypothetical protein HY268_01480 [Deltaproteobacteria bacterium]|nr:hypothetical protein [Deltaproteobacteria bacterium]
MKIIAIRETFTDQWVATKVLKVDKANVPIAGEVIAHGPKKQQVYRAAKQYRAQDPTARMFIFFTGDPIPAGVEAMLGLG